jgi:MFS family permease
LTDVVSLSNPRALSLSFPTPTTTLLSPLQDLPSADVEQHGIRLRVTSKATNRSIHEGTWTPLPPPLEEQQLTKRQSFAAKYGALKPFAIISFSYLLFTITDGAVRMIVLLHAYNKGFTAMQVAIMFSFYELAGVFTNLAAGLMGARWGIKTTLLTGLCVQLCGLGMLFGWQDDWTKTQAIIYVTASQALCGIAKDLTKLGGKTVTKLVTPDEKQSKLFKLVSLLTGFKNSLKGVGYFLGAATVGVSYYLSLGILVGLILLAFPWAIIGLSNNLGRARKENITISQLFNNKHNVNILSLSRIFLFGSRDLWFEVPLPFFLRSPDSGIGWSRTLVGAFLGIFIIVYGQVQSWTPQLVLHPLRQSPPDKFVATYWCALLAVPIAILGGLMLGPNSEGIFGPDASEASAASSLTVLLYAYCILFAVNSSIHSYLIVRYAEGSKVAMNVGVYYCANAVGRLVGTITSGALYSYVGNSVVEGMGVCLFTAVGFSLISTVVDVWLVEDGARKSWMSPFNRCCGKAGGNNAIDGEIEEVRKESKEGEDTGKQATAVSPGINVDSIQLAMSRQTTF